MSEDNSRFSNETWLATHSSSCKPNINTNMPNVGRIEFEPRSYPFCCPICNGRGVVPTGFYDISPYPISRTNAAPETCRSCRGAGVLWESHPTY